MTSLAVSRRGVALVAAVALALAGCATATPTVSAPTPGTGAGAPGGGFEEFPLGDDIEVGPLNVAGVYFQPVDMEPADMAGLSSAEADIHLEADVSALPSNDLGFGAGDWVPGLTVDYEITDPSAKVNKGTLMPMNASDGPHYGANIKLGEAGRYKVKFIIRSPEENGYLLHVDAVTGVSSRFWERPLEVEWDDFAYMPREW